MVLVELMNLFYGCYSGTCIGYDDYAEPSVLSPISAADELVLLQTEAGERSTDIDIDHEHEHEYEHEHKQMPNAPANTPANTPIGTPATTPTSRNCLNASLEVLTKDIAAVINPLHYVSSDSDFETMDDRSFNESEGDYVYV
jgi:hypothetical protein